MSFDKSTKFITNLGTKPFEEFRSGQKIEVMDKNGLWKEATVISYNNQSLERITFTKRDKSIDIICNPRHRWILDSGYITTRLAVGQKIFPFCNGMEYHMSTTTNKLPYDTLWTVSNIEPIQGTNYETWSVIEPVTNSFTLEGHIVTHSEQ